MLLTKIPTEISPLNAEQIKQIQSLANTLSPLQRAWVSGYLAAAANAEMTGAVGGQLPTEAASPAAPLTILYGSQTGNAKELAQSVFNKAKAQGLDAKLVDMADYKPNQLKNERFLTIVASTYGEGEPPEPAEKFYNFLDSKKAPKLDGVKIAVLGIGDSSYEFFCKTAVDFEERLTKLGAEVITEKALFDVDYEDHSDEWIENAVNLFEPELKKNNSGSAEITPFPGSTLMEPTAVSQYNKKNPFTAEVSVVQKITGRDSTKDVRHVEISLEGSDLTYKPGDSLGVYFENDPAEVDTILAALKFKGDEEVTVGKDVKPLRDALIQDFELTKSYPTFVEKYAPKSRRKALKSLLEDKAKMRDFITDRQIYDIILDNPVKISATEFAECLRKIQPRLYSIASSQAEVEEEVHLTVGVVEFEAFDRPHLGGCSGFLGRRIEEGGEAKVFVEENSHFRLPENPTTPLIMVGPGTGIAPFRSFLQERDASEAEGKNWLFFGNPHFTQDFLYQVELQAYLKSGLLTQLDVAFSRDQDKKVYVQDRIREKGKELFAWLEEGAHFYVCGDAERMAKDVNQALTDILMEHGAMSEEKALDYIEKLRDEKRYQKDVY